MKAKMFKYTGQQSYDITPDFLTSVALGKIAGIFYIRKFAYLPVTNLTSPERDIWNFGSAAAPGEDVDYTYPADGTAPIDTISSSSDLDIGKILYLEGLDIDGKLTKQIVTLTGQTKLPISPLWRSYRIMNRTPSTGADRSEGFAGQVYVYEDTAITGGVPDDPTKVRAFCDNGNNSSLMSQYCCPAGHTGLLLAVEPKIIKKGAASIEIKAYVREYGKVFRLVDVGSLSAAGTSAFTIESYIPLYLLGRTDMVITGDSDTNGVGISVLFYVLLFDNNEWAILESDIANV